VVKKIPEGKNPSILDFGARLESAPKMGLPKALDPFGKRSSEEGVTRTINKKTGGGWESGGVPSEESDRSPRIPQKCSKGLMPNKSVPEGKITNCAKDGEKKSQTHIGGDVHLG